jgi:hypothetical protein
MDSIPQPTSSRRITTRRRISTHQSERKLMEVSRVYTHDEIYDTTFKIVKNIYAQLKNFNYRVLIGTSGTTLPNYFRYTFFKGMRNPHEFDFQLNLMKSTVSKFGFSPINWNNHLFAHSTQKDLFLYIKRYKQANAIDIYVYRVYNDYKLTALDIL